MRILLIILILLFTTNLYAEEYYFNKLCNIGKLTEELEDAGIDLEGQDQIGYINTNDHGDIKIVILQGSIDENVLNQVIQDHQYQSKEDKDKEDKDNRKSAKDKLKNLGLTNAELEVLF